MIFPATFKDDEEKLVTDYKIHRQYNYDLCTAIDLTRLGSVLDRMVESGHLDKQMAVIYRTQADALLAALRSENNRAFGE